MSVNWVMLIPSLVFTRVKTNFSQTIKDKYSMSGTNFSTVGSSDTPAVFPFVYIITMDAQERGQDLEGTSINGGLFSFQIEVTDNKKQQNAKEVIWEVIRIFKSMGFELVSFPTYQDSKDTHRAIARVRRVIGVNDKF